MFADAVLIDVSGVTERRTLIRYLGEEDNGVGQEWVDVALCGGRVDISCQYGRTNSFKWMDAGANLFDKSIISPRFYFDLTLRENLLLL